MRDYDELARTHGDSPLSVGWGSKDRREIRFEILSSLWSLQNSSVLDVGCGLGDFYKYLKESRGCLDMKYLGIDSSHELIKIANMKHPSANFMNTTLSIFGNTVEKFDYVFASGIFNDARPHHLSMMKSEIQTMYSIARKGLAFNFLNNLNDRSDEGVQYTSIEKVLEFCFSLSKRIVLRNDYMPFESTIFIYLENEIDNKSITFLN